MKEQHSNTGTSHFIGPVSLLQFKKSLKLGLTSGTLAYYNKRHGYGDGKVTYRLDREMYRYTEGLLTQLSQESTGQSIYQCWNGYAPHFPLPELRKSFPSEVIKHGEVDLHLSAHGIELASFYNIPLVVYSIPPSILV